MRMPWDLSMEPDFVVLRLLGGKTLTVPRDQWLEFLHRQEHQLRCCRVCHNFMVRTREIEAHS